MVPADQYNIALVENTIEIERPVDQTTITKRYTKKAVEFINKNKNQSFFLYLAHSMAEHMFQSLPLRYIIHPL